MPASAAEPELGLLSLCSDYYYHASFLMQSTSLLSLATVPPGACPNLMKDFLLSHPRPQERGGFWLERGSTRVSLLQALLRFLTKTCHTACSTSHPIHATAKLKFTLLLAGSSSGLNPFCAALCPNRPSTSFSDACFEFFTGVTGSADSRSEALSRLNFPIRVLPFIKSVLNSCPGSC